MVVEGEMIENVSDSIFLSSLKTVVPLKCCSNKCLNILANCMSTTLDHKAENGTQVTGVQIAHQMDGVDYTYGLAVKKKVSVLV